jgi:SAM-dependent methyltransferase
MTTTHASCPYCTAIAPVAWVDRAKRMTSCRTCAAWFVWPRPSPEQMAEYYAAGDRGMPRELREWREGTSQQGWYDHLAKAIRRRAEREVTSVVDVGAGGLELTLALTRSFPAAKIEAWDLFADEDLSSVPSSLGAAAGSIAVHRIDLNRLEGAPAPERQFDVVACVAVIEHVLDPLALLRFLRSLTAPGGIAYVVGPDAGSLARRLLGRRWPYYAPDEHLTIPTLDSMRRAVSIAGGGPCAIRRVAVHYSLRYLLRFLRVPLPIPASADLLLPVPAGAFELVWQKGKV